MNNTTDKWYKLYVEGELHETYVDKKDAIKAREEATKEGWNVQLIEMRNSIMGSIGGAI